MVTYNNYGGCLHAGLQLIMWAVADSVALGAHLDGIHAVHATGLEDGVVSFLGRIEHTWMQARTSDTALRNPSKAMTAI